MLRVAICDDERVACSEIEDIICSYKEQSNIDIDTEIFYSGEELCQYITSGHSFDIIFLDIEMSNINGIEVGRILREDLNDDITQLVYVSCKQSYAMSLFANRPLNFLIKPATKQEIIAQIEKAIKLAKQQNEYFKFSISGLDYQIKLKNIMWFQSQGRKIKVNSVDGTFEFYGKLSTIISDLPGLDYILIHKSYIVNYNYVVKSSYDSVLLTNGITLPISQAFRKSVRDILLERQKYR